MQYRKVSYGFCTFIERYFFQFRQLFFQAETVEFVDKVRHQLFHALDLFGSPGIDAGESVSCRQVAFEGVVESMMMQ